MFVHVDVDECQSENGGCEQNCTNTVGSFFCNCSDGFMSRNDSFQCDGKINNDYIHIIFMGNVI